MTEGKYERLANIVLPLLKCIACDGTQLSLESREQLRCGGCGAGYVVHEGIPVMLADPAGALDFNSDHVVENRYSRQWLDVVEATPDGVVLDFGSGNNPDRFDNVVKMDIFAVPNVDVVGHGETLPFRDDSLSAVMSGAVFEHVQDPFLCARNLHRAMRPGARIYVETAFLQPYHAYPHHYFNMTTKGAAKVFEAFVDGEVGVQPWQAPLFTISWILRRWAEILPEAERAEFLSASVGDILAEAGTNPFSRRWSTTFVGRDDEELACGVFFRGRKA